MNQVEVRLIRMDVPTPSGFFCTLYANQARVGVISSMDHEDPSNLLQVPHSGTLKLTVSSHSCLLGSVSFPSGLVTESGCFWLPVLPSGSSDYISVLPEEIQSPKLLLYFDIKPPAEPLAELTEQAELAELAEARSKLEKISQNFEDFIKTAKTRELVLLKSLEQKEVEAQDYIEKLHSVQSRNLILAAEKKKILETLNRLQEESKTYCARALREELEMTRQELFKAESRNDLLMKKLEDVQAEWSFYEEESKHVRESELMNQLIQLRHELDLKNQEIQMIKSSSSLQDVSNKQEFESIEIVEAKFMQKQAKCSANASCIDSSLRSSFVLEDEAMHQSLLLGSRGVSPSLKENMRKTPEIEKSRSSYKFATISSNNKSKFTPLNVSRRAHKSVEKTNK